MARGDYSNCLHCTWPYRPDGWANATRFWNRTLTLTLDTSCVNAKQGIDALNRLEVWATKRLVLLQRTEALIDELPPESRQAAKAATLPVPVPEFVFGSSVLGGGALKGPWLPDEMLRPILFPTTSAPLLTVRQRQDILHLQLHVWHGGDCFVTLNSRDFSRDGKGDTLARLGIWTFMPANIVRHLENGWREKGFEGG